MYVCEESKKGVGRCVRDCVRDCVKEIYVGPVLGLCRDKCRCERNTFLVMMYTILSHLINNNGNCLITWNLKVIQRNVMKMMSALD